ncbi:hypothetical protein MA16_Dca000789 [Dendrobium catenatum]|uniref:Secreted protein n=1 Tax=Dendrobium catenatum TaxID=906689 RepID=A0A2I0WUV2_9ASPA|nr:hypothetical protein MA16_Dca000789 [Dendrobium catenatum]
MSPCSGCPCLWMWTHSVKCLLELLFLHIYIESYVMRPGPHVLILLDVLHYYKYGRGRDCTLADPHCVYHKYMIFVEDLLVAGIFIYL